MTFAETIELANRQLKDYSFTVDPHDGCFVSGRTGRKLGARILTYSKGRFRIVVDATGSPLWSGVNVEAFVRSYWFAEKVN